MSRFTRPPFHKPSPFDIPRPVHPLSPPETDITADSVPLPPMSIVSRDMGFTDIGASSSFTRVDTPESYHHAANGAIDTQPSTSHGRFRPRPSHLGYLHHPGSVRSDLRAAPRSATRWLVMVIPPPAIAREHGHGMFLNHSSSSDSHTRQGVLLPLLPSLSGQLSAIAREFSFPSTTGICIYLHMSDGGIAFAPRISDEAWSILWGAAFDERQSMHGMGGLPVAGRIEFDLDLRKARWFDMWLSSVKRNSVDMGSSVSVNGHGLGLGLGPGTFSTNLGHPGHRREDSRTTARTFEHTEDSAVDDVSVTIQRKVPVVRHVPRKLSLLDRVDVSTIKPSPRPASRTALTPTDAEHPRLVLSPVAQTPSPITVPVTVEDDEPQTATATPMPMPKVVRRVDVERKVESWRASSSFAKSPLVASTGQTALDPTNMPNDQPLIESDADALVEPLNLDDFTWSISSAGPLSADYDYHTHIPAPLYGDSARLPSVHLDARLEGSVCLTPTTCTSFGPPEYDPFSPVASLIDRLPSPDIASRQFEDAPPTPSTATSWGAPSEWPASPTQSLFRAPSVDLAARQLESRPVTPSTATSWGAPLEWPVSPLPRFRAPSVDLGARQSGSRPVTPSTATSWGAPLEWPASPATPFYVNTPGVGSMFFDGQDEESALLERGRVLRSYGAGDEEPHRSLGERDGESESSKPWKFVWPYRQNETIDSQEPIPIRVQVKYPYISLYPAVYPHFDLYPASVVSSNSIKSAQQPPRRRDGQLDTELAQPPKTKPWKHVWPYQKATNDTIRPISVRLESSYPSFNLYPAVYPYFDLYPAKPCLSGTTREVSVRLRPTYPRFSIYPAVYPNFEIYPGYVVEMQRDKSVSVRLQVKYPCIQPYPAVYPHFELYPDLPTVKSVKTSGSKQPPRKPDLPPSAEVSPTQKASPWKYVWPYQQVAADIPPPARAQLAVASRQPPRKRDSPPTAEVSQTLKAAPWKHVWPYQRVDDVSHPIKVQLESKYPSFDLYPAVYPYFDLYPPKAPAFGTTKEVSVKLQAKYPAFSIYPALYPNFEIYPGHVVEKQRNPRELLSVTLQSAYPEMEIYSPVYPYLVIYPEVTIERKQIRAAPVPSIPRSSVPRKEQKNAKRVVDASSAISVTLESTYPILDIYPAVYPYFDIYRSGKASTPEGWHEPRPVTLGAKYPVTEIYPPVYPYFNIYRSGTSSTPEYWREPRLVALHAKYPVMEIYPPVYPYFDIYRSGTSSTPEYWREPRCVTLRAKYPVMETYPPVYPYFDIYKSGQVSDPTPLTNRLSTKLKAKYPAFDIYPAVYPSFELYPSIKPMMQASPRRRRARRTHQDLVDIVQAQRVRASSAPRISISSYDAQHRPRRTHKELVDRVFSKADEEGRSPSSSRARAPVRAHSPDVPQDVSGSTDSPRRTSRASHIPIRPSEIRRSISLGQATMSSSVGVARSQSLRHLPSVHEESAGSRVNGSVGVQRLQHRDSPAHIVERRTPMKRDSIVLERARHWGAGAAPDSKPNGHSRDSSISRVSMKDLSEFPMPPLPSAPSVPGLPNGRPASSINRPVAKLDRTKFPFR